MGKNNVKDSNADNSFLLNNVFIKPEKEQEFEHLESSLDALIALSETAPKIGLVAHINLSLVAHINLGLVERFNFGLID